MRCCPGRHTAARTMFTEDIGRLGHVCERSRLGGLLPGPAVRFPG